MSCHTQHKLVCAIDPGLSRLAVAAAWIDVLSGEIVSWECCMTLNLLRMAGECVASCCKYNHTKEIVDGFNHLIARFDVFDKCDVLLIERQPPQGHVTIQNLFLQHFGTTKVQMVDPNSRNTHFGWRRGQTTRWQRKHAATSLVLSRKYLDLVHGFCGTESVPSPMPTAWELEEMRRLTNEAASTSHATQELFIFDVHDRADAVLLVVFWLDAQQQQSQPQPRVIVSKYFPPPPIQCSTNCRSATEFRRGGTRIAIQSLPVPLWQT